MGPGRCASADRARPAAQPPEPGRGRAARDGAIPRDDQARRRPAFALQAPKRRARAICRLHDRGEAVAARFRLCVQGQRRRRGHPAQLHPGCRGRRRRGIEARPARLSGCRPDGHSDHRPVPRCRQLGHGLQDGRPAGDPGSLAEMRADPVGADRLGRGLGPERVYGPHPAARVGASRSAPRL